MQRAAECARRPVLILGAVARISVPMARLLNVKCGIEVEVAAMQASDPPLRSKAVRDFHYMPDSHSQPEAFRDKLLKLIEARQYDMIFATQDPALEALCRHYETYNARCQVVSPPPHIVERILDKDLTLEVARKYGVRIPRTFTVSSSEDLLPIARELVFPVVLKPMARKGVAGFKKEFISTLDELGRWLSANRFGQVLLQDYCPGDGVGVEMLIHNGECIAVFQHRRRKEFPASGGAAVTAVAEVPDRQMVEESLNLLRALEWQGVAMVEFRHDPKTGIAALMEVNGRYWGTSSLPFMAGVEFPVYQWRIAHGLPPQVPETYSVGMKWRWTGGYIARYQRLLTDRETRPEKASLFSEVAGIPSDFMPGVRDSVWSWSDMRPGFDEWQQSVSSVVKTGLKSVAKKVIPKRLTEEIRQYREFKPAERPIYRALRMQHSLGWRDEKARRALPSAASFLFVCHGNIMRSPMCEALFRRATCELPSGTLKIASAGLHARLGNFAHPRALLIAREFGISLEPHRAQPVTEELIAKSDAIFAMDYENLVKLHQRFPRAIDKVFMLSSYGDADCGLEIHDPFFGDEEETRRCYQSLKVCIENLARSVVSAKIGAGADVSSTAAVPNSR